MRRRREFLPAVSAIGFFERDQVIYSPGRSRPSSAYEPYPASSSSEHVVGRIDPRAEANSACPLRVGVAGDLQSEPVGLVDDRLDFFQRQ